MSDPKEFKIPMAILAVGLALSLVYGLFAGGATGPIVMMAAVLFALVINVALGLIAFFLTAKITGAGFGLLQTAALKLAAIIALDFGLSSWIPLWFVTLIASFLVFYILLQWLFDLDAMEVVVCLIVLVAVRFFAGLLLVPLLYAV